jgi:GTP-binding protein HflX
LIEKQSAASEEKAALVGIITRLQPEPQTMEYLTELAFLAETAGAVPVK